MQHKDRYIKIDNKIRRINKNGTLDMRYKGRLISLDTTISNTKRKKTKRYNNRWLLTDLVAIDLFLLFLVLIIRYNLQVEYREPVSPVVKENQVLGTYTHIEPADIITVRDVENNKRSKETNTTENAKQYLKKKFGKNYKIACMVAYGESLNNPLGINNSKIEYSVGVFQINLADNYGNGNRIHWDKVQGNTLKEKTEYLQDYKNNIDLAYTMSNGGEDFNQWMAYTNGSYLRHSSKCL